MTINLKTGEVNAGEWLHWTWGEFLDHVIDHAEQFAYDQGDLDGYIASGQRSLDEALNAGDGSYRP